LRSNCRSWLSTSLTVCSSDSSVARSSRIPHSSISDFSSLKRSSCSAIRVRSFRIFPALSGSSQKSALAICFSISWRRFSLAGRSKITSELFEFQIQIFDTLFQFGGHKIFPPCIGIRSEMMRLPLSGVPCGIARQKDGVFPNRNSAMAPSAACGRTRACGIVAGRPDSSIKIGGARLSPIFSLPL